MTYLQGAFYFLQNHQSLLNQCPASNTCCFSLPPKLGTIIIAVLGLIISVCYILLFFAGEEILPRTSDTAGQVIMHTYAVIGILLFSACIILLVAAFKYIQTFILLYLWTTIFCCIVDVITVLYIAVSAFYGKNVTQGVLLCTCDAVYWVTFYLFLFPTVNGFRRSIQTILIVVS